jgi:4-hydroxy-4-methyl-2-oxoglutarate aldolase
VSLGGTAIEPGDLVVADADGVVVVGKAKVKDVLAQAGKKLDYEAQRLADIRGGGALRPAWLDGALRQAGVLAEGETL